jgi:hypothetical protein
MPHYMLVLHEEPMDYSQMSPEDIEAVIREYIEWSQAVEAKGKYVGGQKLKDEGGRHLNGFGSGFRVTDGPYAEAKEIIGGFFTVSAADYDEAVELSSDCPHLKYGGRVELREIQPTE